MPKVMKKKVLFEDSDDDDDDDRESAEDNEDDDNEESEEDVTFDKRDKTYRILHEQDSDDEDEDDGAGDDEEDAGDEEEAEEEEEEERGESGAEGLGEIELPWLRKKDEGEQNEDEEDPKTVGERIKELVEALSEKSSSRKQSRSDLLEQLLRDCCSYYGYLRDLIDIFSSLFSPAELIAFLDANASERPVVIRVNTIKSKRRNVAQALIARGVSLEPLGDWSDVGLKIFESTVPVGATPEYLAGHYMLQSASSFAPVISLDPQPGEKVLDMCAAPGGKTTYICQLMHNTGLVVANDAKKPRIAALMSNIARLGIRNALVVNHDGRDFPKVMGGFNRILLDAPCSGLGVISRDPSVKMTRTMQDIIVTAQLQRELLLAAVDSCLVGGVIVYSTCSITVEENERVVQYCLDNRNVKLVESGIEFGKPGLKRYKGILFDDKMSLAKRLYPHQHNMDGFFIAKLVKYDNGSKKPSGPKKIVEKTDKTGKRKPQKVGRVQQIGFKKSPAKSPASKGTKPSPSKGKFSPKFSPKPVSHNGSSSGKKPFRKPESNGNHKRPSSASGSNNKKSAPPQKKRKV